MMNHNSRPCSGSRQDPTGFVAEPMVLFLARGLRAGAAQPEADEVILKRWVSLSRSVRMATSGTIRDSKTISGVLWFEHAWRTGKLEKPRRARFLDSP